MPRPELVVSMGKAREAGAVAVRDAVLVYLDSLYRFALRLTGNAEQAKDLTQDAVLRAWKHRNKFVREPRAWLMQTLYHTFVSHHRRGAWKETGFGELCDQDDWGDETEGIAGPLPALIPIEDVRNAVESLPEEFRAVVWLSDAEEFRLREIAEILGCPLGTVASRLARGRRELRRLLSAYDPEQEK